MQVVSAKSKYASIEVAGSGSCDNYRDKGFIYYAKEGKDGMPDLSALDEKKIANPKDAITYMNRGVQYAKNHHYDPAISNFDKAIQLDPKLVTAYYNRGLAYKMIGQYDKAISDYNKALELDQRYIQAFTNRGNAYLEGKGDSEQAIYNYNKALEINPMDAEVYISRGYAYYFKGDYDKAWEDVHMAHRLGFEISSEFFNALCKSSGRQK